jgi:hypothetical protein
VTSIVANIDGGQPWRRGYGEALTFTDWTRNNFFVGVQELVTVKGCIGVEFDHMSQSGNAPKDASRASGYWDAEHEAVHALDDFF